MPSKLSQLKEGHSVTFADKRRATSVNTARKSAKERDGGGCGGGGEDGDGDGGGRGMCQVESEGETPGLACSGKLASSAAVSHQIQPIHIQSPSRLSLSLPCSLIYWVDH